MIFISYSHKNGEEANRLKRDLEAREYHVWMDPNILGSERWRTEITENLDKSSALVVLLSPESVLSKFVEKEVSYVQGQKKPVHPFLIKPYDTDDSTLGLEEVSEIQYHDAVSESYEAAFESLCRALKPPLPEQKLLDDRVDAYQKTGSLLSEGDLKDIEKVKEKLYVSEFGEELIKKSKRYYRNKLLYTLLGALAGGVMLILLYGSSNNYMENDEYSLRTTFYIAVFLIGLVGSLVYMFGRKIAFEILRDNRSCGLHLISGGLISTITTLMVLGVIAFLLKPVEEELIGMVLTISFIAGIFLEAIFMGRAFIRCVKNVV